jgi:hypothetical protein
MAKVTRAGFVAAMMLSVLVTRSVDAAAGDTDPQNLVSPPAIALAVAPSGATISAACQPAEVIKGANTTQVVVAGTAQATPGTAVPVATAIYVCSVTSAGGGSVSAPPVGLPGPAAATAATGSVSLGRLTPCVAARALLSDGSVVDTGRKCP